LFRRSLHDFEVGAAAVHAIVVEIETAAEAETGVEHERAHECRRAVTELLERGRQGRRRRAEVKRAVVADPIA